MRVLFVMRHSGYVRNFESAIRLLCDRGHHVHVGFQARMPHWLLDSTDIGRQLSAQYPTFSQGIVPLREDGWGMLGQEVRLVLDYLRYLTPMYARAPKLRRRVEREIPASYLAWTRRGPLARAALKPILEAADRAIPTDPAIDAHVRELRPDLVLVTPLMEPGSPQADYVRSARAAGVPAVLCVASWDNLTNKGLIHDPVDLVTVWNDAMRDEAVRLHGIPADRVVVTGAQPFDHWFDWQPAGTREAFCARAGLASADPYLLYLCSSKFVAPDEAAFVRRWVEQLRASSSERLRRAGVLVRPHPQNAKQWQGFDRSGLGDVTIFPAAGAAPVDAATRGDYFESIYHCAAAVGVNTTAEIECAIVGRPVFTLLAPEFRDTQEGTIHFEHLRQANGGLVQVAASFEEHLSQLDAELASPGAGADRCGRFVDAFVRPFGRGEPATPRLVDALERLAARPRAPGARPPAWATAVRPALRRRAAQLEAQANAAERAKAERDAARARREAAKQERIAKKLAEKTRQEDERRAREARKAAASREERLTELAGSYGALSHAERVQFFERIVDGIPSELWFELQRANAERLDFPDAEIRMRVTSKAERVRLRACAKEPWTVAWIRQFRPDEVFYDIGANVGAYSLVAAANPAGGARVVAFEPSYPNVNALCANVVLNDLASRITPLPVALADANAASVLNLIGLAPGGARHTLGAGAPGEAPTVYPQPVLTFRLDDLVEQAALPLPNHIKLDVDGGEFAVLGGAARVLASPGLRSVLIEISTELSDAVTGALEGHGLHLQSRVRVRNKAGEYRVWYGLFTRPGAPMDLELASGDEVVAR
ncbi:MAG: FkbM family methyltransferase [Vicinamibacterales bacterium]